jgi:endoglucanase
MRGILVLAAALAMCAMRGALGKITVGINLSGMEEGGKVPGKAYFDYAVPSVAEWEYFASKGIKLVRLPFKWERVQPNASGPLDEAYLGLIKTQLEMAHNNSMQVILDNHGFGSGYGEKLNGNATSNKNFGDLWRRLALEFKGNPAVAGYDVINEPNGMPTNDSWHLAAQAVINEIRTVDTETPLYIEGNHWSGAQGWAGNNPKLHLLDDSKCTNAAFPKATVARCIVWSAHCYLDRDNSGTHFNWTAEVEAGVTVNTGADRLKDFVAWLKEHKFTRAHVGELGAGNDNNGWLVALNNSMALMDENDWELTYWSAGPWFSGSYPYDVDAKTIQTGCTRAEKQTKDKKNCVPVMQDKPQMAVLSQWSGAAPPTVYFTDGPETGPTASVSAPFSLLYMGRITKRITFICHADSVDGAIKMPLLTHTCDIGWNNCEATFNITAAKNGNFTVQCTNDAGLVDAPALPYVSSDDLFEGAAAPAANIFSLRKIFAAYTGPALQLRRSIYSVQRMWHPTSPPPPLRSPNQFVVTLMT